MERISYRTLVTLLEILESGEQYRLKEKDGSFILTFRTTHPCDIVLSKEEYAEIKLKIEKAGNLVALSRLLGIKGNR